MATTPSEPKALEIEEEAMAQDFKQSSTPSSSELTANSAKPEPPVPPTPYTKFTPNEKRLLTLLLGLTTITSPLTAAIYYPLLPLLRTQFHTSAQAINLTITIYVIFQALSPALFGPLSDSLGRRPVYLITLSLYVVGNLGLALNRNNYALLLCLRAVQSLGASAAFAVAYGVVADVAVPSEKGRIIGPLSMALNLGACVGPVIGGWISYRSGSYHWVFWALVIIGGVISLAVMDMLPETARHVISKKGSRKGYDLWKYSCWSLGRKWFQNRRKISDVEAEKRGPTPKDEDDGAGQSILKSYSIRKVLGPIRIIFHRDTFIVLWMHASFYLVDYSLVAAIPDIYKNIYSFNELQTGLSYLPRGVGIIIGGYCIGKLMDYNYKATAKKIGWTINNVSGDNLNHFPIERARSRGSFWLLAISTATLVGYGWAVNKHAYVSILLILQFIEGFWCTGFYTVYNTLLVDVFPDTPSTAAAAASIMRCGMAAAAIAALQPLLYALGRGWHFTALGIWSGGCGALAVWLIRTRGMDWRRQRLSKASQLAGRTG